MRVCGHIDYLRVRARCGLRVVNAFRCDLARQTVDSPNLISMAHLLTTGNSRLRVFSDNGKEMVSTVNQQKKEAAAIAIISSFTFVCGEICI